MINNVEYTYTDLLMYLFKIVFHITKKSLNISR